MARLTPFTVFGVVKDLRAVADDRSWISVGGAPGLASVLAKELARGGEASAVRQGGDSDGALALVYVLAGPPTPDDERAFGRADRAGVPVVCVLAGPELDPAAVPFVLATDIVSVPAGSGFPVEEIAQVLARKLGQRGVRVAVRLPVLRRAVCEELIEGFSRRNALIGAAVFVGGADMPLMTLNQLRLVLLLGAAHGVEVDEERLPEIIGVVGGGLALRALARRLRRVLPLPAWALSSGLAYGGTRAMGEAALRYFEARTQSSSVRSGA